MSHKQAFLGTLFNGPNKVCNLSEDQASKRFDDAVAGEYSDIQLELGGATLYVSLHSGGYGGHGFNPKGRSLDDMEQTLRDMGQLIGIARALQELVRSPENRPCAHESVITPDGHGAYCKFCGEVQQ